MTTPHQTKVPIKTNLPKRVSANQLRPILSNKLEAPSPFPHTPVPIHVSVFLGSRIQVTALRLQCPWPSNGCLGQPLHGFMHSVSPRLTVENAEYRKLDHVRGDMDTQPNSIPPQHLLKQDDVVHISDDEWVVPTRRRTILLKSTR